MFCVTGRRTASRAAHRGDVRPRVGIGAVEPREGLERSSGGAVAAVPHLDVDGRDGRAVGNAGEADQDRLAIVARGLDHGLRRNRSRESSVSSIVALVTGPCRIEPLSVGQQGGGRSRVVGVDAVLVPVERWRSIVCRGAVGGRGERRRGRGAVVGHGRADRSDANGRSVGGGLEDADFERRAARLDGVGHVDVLRGGARAASRTANRGNIRARVGVGTVEPREGLEGSSGGAVAAVPHLDVDARDRRPVGDGLRG